MNAYECIFIGCMHISCVTVERPEAGKLEGRQIDDLGEGGCRGGGGWRGDYKNGGTGREKVSRKGKDLVKQQTTESPRKRAGLWSSRHLCDFRLLQLDSTEAWLVLRKGRFTSFLVEC